MNFSTVLKKPSALLPLAMSVAAMALLVAVWATVGLARQPDEGAAAHIWQLLMGLQLPIIVVFVARWMPRAPKATLGVLALQVAAAAAACFPVFYFRL